MTRKQALKAMENGYMIVYHSPSLGDIEYQKITDVRTRIIEGHDKDGNKIRGQITSVHLLGKCGISVTVARARDCSIIHGSGKI